MKTTPQRNILNGFNAMIAGLLVATGLILAMIGPADAAISARKFFSPDYLGQPVVFCLETDKACGKPAATVWCQQNGYEQALSFARTKAQAGQELRFADTGNAYSGQEAEVFSQIRCIKGE